MQNINDHHLDHITGGGDPISQPLSMPPGWTPVQIHGPCSAYTITDYLKSIGIVLAQ
jgi:hypothetical protein